MTNTATNHTSVTSILKVGAASLAFLLTTSSLSHALPSGGNVVVGNVQSTFDGPNILNTTQTTQKAVVDYTNVNTANGEVWNINQPSTFSILLNRVNGAPSSFDGALNANGQVWFVNKQGFTWGPNAQVNVGGLITSAADISNNDFISGNYNFTIPGAKGASIANKGMITTNSGSVFLGGPNVSNSGTIIANLGVTTVNGVNSYKGRGITLGAAETYTVDFYGDGLISYALGTPVSSGTLSNTGILQADAGRIVLDAKMANSLLDQTINIDGTIRAQSVGDKKGTVIIKSNGNLTVNSDIDVTGNHITEKGGDISIAGRIVNSISGFFDASGKEGGGTVTLSNVDDGNSNVNKSVTLNQNSTIDVSATEIGDAGVINISGINKNNLYGNLKGTSNTASGKGGTVNVNLNNQYDSLVDYNANANLKSLNSKHGSVNIFTRRGVTVAGSFIGSAPDNRIAVANSLNGDSNVAVYSTNSTEGIALSDVNWYGAGNLSLNGPKVQSFYRRIVSDVFGGISINADTFTNHGGLFQTNLGDITISAKTYNGKYQSNSAAYGLRSNGGDITLDLGQNVNIELFENNGFFGNIISSNSGKVLVNLDKLGQSDADLTYIYSMLGEGSDILGSEIMLHGSNYSGPLNMYKDNVTLSSAHGRDHTTFEGVINITGDNNVIDGLTIKRDPNAGANDLGGIFVQDVQSLGNLNIGGGIYNSRLLNGRQELRLTNTEGFEVKNNEFVGLLGAAIGVNGGSNFTIDGNTINGAATGMFVTGSSNGIINNNTLTNFTETGIRLQQGVDSVQVTNNTITGGAIGVADVLSSNNTISGNTISDSILYGVYIEKTQYSLVNGNEIDGAQSAAIAGFDTNDLIIRGNQISDSNTGIQMRTGLNTVIEDNDLNNLANSGISLYNGSHGSVVLNNNVSGVQSGTSILAHNSDDILLKANNVSNSSGTAGIDGAGMSVLNAETATIVDNVFDNIFGYSLEVFNSGDINVGGNSYDDGNDFYIQANSITQVSGGSAMSSGPVASSWMQSSAASSDSSDNTLLAMADQPTGEPVEAEEPAVAEEPTPTEEPTWPGQYLEGEEPPEWELLPPYPGSQDPTGEPTPTYNPEDPPAELPYMPSGEPVETEEPAIAEEPTPTEEPTWPGQYLEGDEPPEWELVPPYPGSQGPTGEPTPTYNPEDPPAELPYMPTGEPTGQYLIGYDLNGYPIYSNEPGWPEPEYPSPTLIPTEPTDGSPTLIPNSPPYNEDPNTEGVVY